MILVDMGASCNNCSVFASCHCGANGGLCNTWKCFPEHSALILNGGKVPLVPSWLLRVGFMGKLQSPYLSAPSDISSKEG